MGKKWRNKFKRNGSEYGEDNENIYAERNREIRGEMREKGDSKARIGKEVREME